MSSLTPRPVRVFSREEPCTKVDLANCFHRSGQFVKRAVVEARGEIGLNAIKYLLKNDYATRFEEANVDYWQLTRAGEEWLTKGLHRWLELHPEATSDLIGQAPGASVRRVRRKP